MASEQRNKIQQGRITPRLELQGITRRFPSVIANDNVNLRVMPGEIHALLGENGAGKSSLMQVVYGSLQADSGQIFWHGEPVTIASPAQARRLGIGMVFQQFSLFESLTVAQNIALGMEQRPQLRQLSARIVEVSQQYGLALQPNSLISTLTIGEKQRVEFIRCLLQKPDLLILDEPTSALAPPAVQALFKTLRQLAAQGCSIVYVTHKLGEVIELCHSATVLKNGKVSATLTPKNETANSLAKMMVGANLPEFQRSPSRPTQTLLEVKQLSRAPIGQLGTQLKDIDFSVRGGEILGIAGVSGNGQRELLSALSGELPATESAHIKINGRSCDALDAGQRRALGLSYIPEERLGRGAVPDMSLSMNALLTGHRSGMTRNGFINHQAVADFADRCIKQFSVECADHHASAKSLSGGNLQKFIVGRELLLNPTVIIVSQPTVGVDVGAARYIRQTLIDQRNQGAAILVLSEELDELLEICDRICVIAGGRLSESLSVCDTNSEAIGVLLSGLFANHKGTEPPRASTQRAGGHGRKE